MTSFASTGPMRPQTEVSRLTWIGAGGLVLLLATLGLWAATTVISGAVIAQGTVVVQGKPQLVQSLDGGIVAEIAVRDGDMVQAGQLLLRLDPTLLSVNLDITRGQLADALARKARLEAEQLGLAAPVFAYPALPFPALDTARHEDGQRQIFQARRDVIQGRREQLRERLAQFGNQLAGIESQITAKRDQLTFLEKDLSNMSSLARQGLARQSQVLDLQRAQADMLGQIAALEADLAGTRNAMQDSELETLQGERNFKEQVVTELREVTAIADELILKIVTHTAQLARVEIRAPADGIIHEMQAATVGGVVGSGATILQVVPVGKGLEFELRIDPLAIDQVHPGQKAEVLVSSFDPRNTPRLVGQVTTISPGAIIDPRTGQDFFRVGLAVSPEEIARLGDVALVPGMPVEGFLTTGDRSVLTYLLQPLTAQISRTFRE